MGEHVIPVGHTNIKLCDLGRMYLRTLLFYTNQNLSLFRANNSCLFRRKHIGKANCQRKTGNIDESYEVSWILSDVYNSLWGRIYLKKSPRRHTQEWYTLMLISALTCNHRLREKAFIPRNTFQNDVVYTGSSVDRLELRTGRMYMIAQCPHCQGSYDESSLSRERILHF